MFWQAIFIEEEGKVQLQVFGGLLEETVCACGDDIKSSEWFTYLGRVGHNTGESGQEVLRRIGLATI